MRERERLAAATDAEVLAAVAAGSQDALEVLYRRLEPRLFRFLVGFLRGDAARAEEAMTDTFFEVWRQAAAFRGASSVLTWIFGIGRYKALSLARRRSTAVADADEMLEHLPAEAPDPLAHLTEAEAAERVRQALDRLSEEHREVIELSLYQEFSYEQIAEIVGCPVNTVKTRAFHARRNLGRHLTALAAREG